MKDYLVKKTPVIMAIICGLVLLAAILPLAFKKELAPQPEFGGTIKLPEPRAESKISVEQALGQRRSVRVYKNEPLTLSEVSQLLWAAQGVTDARGYRTTPSAGALYPLELYLVAGNVEGLAAGVYKYRPAQHDLVNIVTGDKRNELAAAALNQSPVKDGAIDIVFSAVPERTTKKYKERGIRYVYLETGHAAQNVYLQAVALDLGTLVIGAFSDSEVKEILGLLAEEQPLYIMPVGRK